MEMSAVRARSSGLVGPLSATAFLAAPVFLWTIVIPQLSGPGLRAHDGHLATILTHLIGGSTMLLAGAIALRIGATRRWMRWHKPTGYTYLATGAAAAISGIVELRHAQRNRPINDHTRPCLACGSGHGAAGGLQPPLRPAPRLDDPFLHGRLGQHHLSLVDPRAPAKLAVPSNRHALDHLGDALVSSRGAAAMEGGRSRPHRPAKRSNPCEAAP